MASIEQVFHSTLKHPLNGLDVHSAAFVNFVENSIGRIDDLPSVAEVLGAGFDTATSAADASVEASRAVAATVGTVVIELLGIAGGEPHRPVETYVENKQ